MIVAIITGLPLRPNKAISAGGQAAILHTEIRVHIIAVIALFHPLVLDAIAAAGFSASAGAGIAID